MNASREAVSRNPVGLPTAHLQLPSKPRRLLGGLLVPGQELASVVDRHDLDELRDRPDPSCPASGRRPRSWYSRHAGSGGHGPARYPRAPRSRLDAPPCRGCIYAGGTSSNSSNRNAAPPLIPAREVSSGRPDHDGNASGHVLTTVVARAPPPRPSAPLFRTQNRSPARPRKNGPTAGRPVERDVANQRRCPRPRRARSRGGKTMILPPESPLPT